MAPRLSCLLMLWLAIPGAASAGEPVEEAPQLPSSGAWFENPSRTRGLLGSTALPLHAGEGFIGQQALFATVAEVGLSERVSVNFASATPFQLMFTETSFFSLLGGIKLTTPLTEKLHLAVGVQGGTYDSDLAGSLGFHNAVATYGTLTYGTGDANLSLTVQPIYTWAENEGGLMVLPMLGGFLRVGEHWGLAGEVAISPVRAMADAFAFATAGARLMGPRWSVDLGVLAGTQLQGQDTPAFVPSASFLYHWR
ncbi:MAG: hypothetical protein EOO71_03075 [Myxococcaceae bacterium]|nr:MAG: hypothetical protein EOO71_03075 [Myxococcaceae bacterium]